MREALSRNLHLLGAEVDAEPNSWAIRIEEYPGVKTADLHDAVCRAG